MQVILLEKIHNLGDIGDTVNVKSGYARNFLLPQDKVVTATAYNVAKFEKMRSELENRAAELLATAKLRAETLNKLVINIAMQTAEEGRLYGSVGSREIVEAYRLVGEKIDKNEVIMPEGPIRIVGEHEIKLQLHSDLTIPVKITVSHKE